MTIMIDDRMMAQMSGKDGFIAALDQSGGSTPGALRLYGIPDNAYSGDAEMFRLVHEMRVRIVTAPAFTGAKVIAAILFEGTMDGEVRGNPTPAFLWKERGVVPFVKVDKGLEAEKDGVLRPMPELVFLSTWNRRSRGLEPERCGSPFPFYRVKKLAGRPDCAQPGRTETGSTPQRRDNDAPGARDASSSLRKGAYLHLDHFVGFSRMAG
jgi:hypothetical protein